jgi:hypothetical protein
MLVISLIGRMKRQSGQETERSGVDGVLHRFAVEEGVGRMITIG